MFYDMCIDWWFNKFAMENKSHKCPGCDKKRNRKTWIILCYHINYGGCIEEPREDKKSNKFCVEKVSINWKLCVQENLSTLCFESL